MDGMTIKKRLFCSNILLENSIKYKNKAMGHLRITLEESGRLVLADDHIFLRRLPEKAGQMVCTPGHPGGVRPDGQRI